MLRVVYRIHSRNICMILNDYYISKVKLKICNPNNRYLNEFIICTWKNILKHYFFLLFSFMSTSMNIKLNVLNYAFVIDLLIKLNYTGNHNL